MWDVLPSLLPARGRGTVEAGSMMPKRTWYPTAETDEQLTELARREDRPVAWMVRWIVEQYLREQEKGNR